MTTITLVRHGETDWNLQRRIQGSTDIPLNDTGRRQAGEAATALAARISANGPVHVFSSDLSRASETARIIAAALGLADPRPCPELRERRYGRAEGMSLDEYAARYGTSRDAIPGSEPRADLRERALRAMGRITRVVRRESTPAEPQVIVVSHGGLIRELISHASQGVRPQPDERIANGSLHTFRLEHERLALLSTSCVSAA